MNEMCKSKPDNTSKHGHCEADYVNLVDLCIKQVAVRQLSQIFTGAFDKPLKCIIQMTVQHHATFIKTRRQENGCCDGLSISSKF